jgi:CMP-N,N'-diacetyllegionaminic acid synthase
MRVLAIIPARGNSKSIPFKNIKLFCGKPLVTYSIETALACSLIERTIVSTDSEKIAEVARNAGAEVPFLRPDEYANDDTPDLPVFVHCLDWLNDNEGYVPDIIVHLRPTSPLRYLEMVEDGIQMLVDDPATDSVRAVCEPAQNPFKMWKIKEDSFLSPLVEAKIKEQWNQPRQKLPTVYWQNGYVDVTRGRTILEKHSMTGDKIKPLIVDNENIIDIDNELTFQLAEMMYERRLKIP